MLKAVSKEVFIQYWTLSKKSLETVVRASSNAARIIVCYSKIECMSDFDFSGPNYITNYFALSLCRDNMKDGWSADPTKLERIIKAISLTTMKLSLNTFNVFKSGVSKVIMENMLAKYGMRKINVIEEGVNLPKS